MIIHHTMPPLSERMPYTINEDVCKVCAPKGNFVFHLHYDNISLDCFEDFNLAHEMKMAPFTRQPMVLISQRVKQLFNDLRIKPVYKPVIVVEDE